MKVTRIHTAARRDVDTLETYQALPLPQYDADPFILLNHHGPQDFAPNNSGLPFGPHPHRGFETLTFILEGELTHRDSTGGEHRSLSGGVQWMTAGKGIVHAEESSDVFKEQGGRINILQLWMNLPAKLKGLDPAYYAIDKADLPVVSKGEGHANVHLISGEFAGTSGPVDSPTQLFTAWANFEGGDELTIDVPKGRTFFVYVVNGRLAVNGETIETHDIPEFEGDGGEVTFKAEHKSTVILCHGEPINEPMASYGPFVMNTQEEIHQAIMDYQSGKMGVL